MDNLQKEIVDERRGQYIKTLELTTVGSMGTFGLKAGIGPDLGTPTIFGGDPFQPPPLIQHHFRLDAYSGRYYITGLAEVVSVSDSIQISLSHSNQNIQPPRLDVGHSVPSPFRKREIEWRRTHAIALRQYENQWVVLEGEEIIAHSSDAAQAIRQAKSRGIRTPYIFFVEPESDRSVRIGL
jgi:Family of unknown function (DUF5678)